MKLLIALALALASLSFFFAKQPLRVYITPDSYRVGEAVSALATPAVEEAVRLKPKKMLIVACRETKPPKIIQFERELRARLEVDIQLLVHDEECLKAK